MSELSQQDVVTDEMGQPVEDKHQRLAGIYLMEHYLFPFRLQPPRHQDRGLVSLGRRRPQLRHVCPAPEVIQAPRRSAERGRANPAEGPVDGGHHENVSGRYKYSDRHPVSSEVLKFMFWKVPMAGWPQLWLATAQTEPRNFSQHS